MAASVCSQVLKCARLVAVDPSVVLEVAAGVRDDAARDRAGEPVGRADGVDGLADIELVAVPELGVLEREPAALHLGHVEPEEGEVRPVVPAHQLGADPLQAGQRDVDLHRPGPATWALVRISPSWDRMTPEPMPASNCAPRRQR